MTDNEIISGFNHCLYDKNNSCNGCSFKGEICDGSLNGKIATLRMVANLINRQKAEIENLNKDLADTIALNHEERKGLNAEIERLNNELKITREYLHDNGLEFDLLSYSKRNGG